MKKSLKKINKELYYYKDGGKIIVTQDTLPDFISGNVSGISGNVSGITGDVSGITGYVSGIWGNVTNITGDVTNITGNLDDCEITEEERKKGVNINELIK